MARRLPLTISLWVVSVLTAPLAVAGHPSVDGVVRHYMDVHHIPAVSVAVIQGGRSMVARGYGLANEECNLPASRRKDYSKDDILRLIADEPTLFSAGDRWQYSNSGYFLLGRVIEKVTGLDYDSFLTERIFGPLGMTATRLNSVREIIPRRAQGYVWNGGQLQLAGYLSPTQPWSAGGLVSTIDDLIKWDAALSSRRLQSSAGLQEM